MGSIVGDDYKWEYLEEILSNYQISTIGKMGPSSWTSGFLNSSHGMGGFRAKLHSFGQDVDPHCNTCGVPVTVEHVVTTCTAYYGLGAAMMRTSYGSKNLYILLEDNTNRTSNKKIAG